MARQSTTKTPDLAVPPEVASLAAGAPESLLDLWGRASAADAEAAALRQRARDLHAEEGAASIRAQAAVLDGGSPGEHQQASRLAADAAALAAAEARKCEQRARDLRTEAARAAARLSTADARVWAATHLERLDVSLDRILAAADVLRDAVRAEAAPMHAAAWVATACTGATPSAMATRPTPDPLGCLETVAAVDAWAASIRRSPNYRALERVAAGDEPEEDPTRRFGRDLAAAFDRSDREDRVVFGEAY